MSGTVVTIKCFEDNGLIRQVLSQPGGGRVLVVDGGGSDRCALLGGELARLAERQGWAGLVVHGCVRDLSELIEAQVGVWAIANHPRRPASAGVGAKDLSIDLAGVLVRPGEFLIADADGVLVSEKIL
jgi:regulator of ribonuclease activity A